MMKESTSIDFCKALFSLSRSRDSMTNALFRIAFLIPLDYSIVKKVFLLKNREPNFSRVSFKKVKICKSTDLIIKGMLDENDDIEFAKKNQWYVPVLKNQGECGVGYYKENVRDFLINIVYSMENTTYVQQNINALNNSNNINVENLNGDSLVQFTVLFIPGLFYLTNIPESLVSDKLSIKQLENMISYYSSLDDKSIACHFIYS